jgi:hypothetical protein
MSSSSSKKQRVDRRPSSSSSKSIPKPSPPPTVQSSVLSSKSLLIHILEFAFDAVQVFRAGIPHINSHFRRACQSPLVWTTLDLKNMKINRILGVIEEMKKSDDIRRAVQRLVMEFSLWPIQNNAIFTQLPNLKTIHIPVDGKFNLLDWSPLLTHWLSPDNSSLSSSTPKSKPAKLLPFAEAVQQPLIKCVDFRGSSYESTGVLNNYVSKVWDLSRLILPSGAVFISCPKSECNCPSYCSMRQDISVSDDDITKDPSLKYQYTCHPSNDHFGHAGQILCRCEEHVYRCDSDCEDENHEDCKAIYEEQVMNVMTKQNKYTYSRLQACSKCNQPCIPIVPEDVNNDNALGIVDAKTLQWTKVLTADKQLGYTISQRSSSRYSFTASCLDLDHWKGFPLIPIHMCCDEQVQHEAVCLQCNPVLPQRQRCLYCPKLACIHIDSKKYECEIVASPLPCFTLPSSPQVCCICISKLFKTCYDCERLMCFICRRTKQRCPECFAKRVTPKDCVRRTMMATEESDEDDDDD